MATPSAITVKLASDVAGSAKVSLYLCDNALADASAAQAASGQAQLTGSGPATVELIPDPDTKQHGKSYSEMIEPSYYVSIGDGDLFAPPIFDVKPGETVEMSLKKRSA